MPSFKDQIGRELDLKGQPKRVVSLVPSLSELVVDLVGSESLVGCTAWCVHPKSLRENSTVIGGTKDVNIDLVKSLQPDLILANKEENQAEQVESLAQNFPVYVSDVRSVDHCLKLLSDLGKILACENQAMELIHQAKALRSNLPKKEATFLYFIWKDPYMVASKDSYISALLEERGFTNLAPETNRYPSLSWSEIEALKPDLILLGSEPYAFNAGDSLDFFKSGFKTKIIDGELVSWYGSRLIKGLKYLNKL